MLIRIRNTEEKYSKRINVEGENYYKMLILTGQKPLAKDPLMRSFKLSGRIVIRIMGPKHWIFLQILFVRCCCFSYVIIEKQTDLDAQDLICNSERYFQILFIHSNSKKFFKMCSLRSFIYYPRWFFLGYLQFSSP